MAPRTPDDNALDAIGDPIKRALRASEMMDDHRAAIGALAAARADAIRQARTDGMSVNAIAEALGVTRQTVHRITTEHA